MTQFYKQGNAASTHATALGPSDFPQKKAGRFQAKMIYVAQKRTKLLTLKPAVSSVAKRTLTVREVWGSITGPVKSTQCRQRLATVATFLRSCVAQALSRGDGPRNSLHASA